MKDERSFSSGCVTRDLIEIGDIAIGLDETFDSSEESIDRMRQAALTYTHTLVDEMLDELLKVDELLQLSIDSLSALNEIGGTDPIVEHLRECLAILFKNGNDVEEDEEDGEDDEDDEDGEDA